MITGSWSPARIPWRKRIDVVTRLTKSLPWDTAAAVFAAAQRVDEQFRSVDDLGPMEYEDGSVFRADIGQVRPQRRIVVYFPWHDA